MNTTVIRLLHRFRRTHPWRFVPGYEQHGTTTPSLLVCDNCEVAIEVTLPPGHPESLTAELTAAEEMTLGEIEASEWPETADLDHCRDVLERVYPLDYLRPGDE